MIFSKFSLVEKKMAADFFAIFLDFACCWSQRLHHSNFCCILHFRIHWIRQQQQRSWQNYLVRRNLSLVESQKVLKTSLAMKGKKLFTYSLQQHFIFPYDLFLTYRHMWHIHLYHIFPHCSTLICRALLSLRSFCSLCSFC